MEVSSSVPILECGFGIVHQEEEDEVVVQESGCVLQDVEVAYFLVEESLLDLEEVGHPMEGLLGVELVNVGDQVEGLPAVVPYDVDEVVPQVLVGAP